MPASAVKLWELYEGLKNRFLFNNDINSIYILLSLYDLEENISNIYPQYICTRKINNRIKNILKNRNNPSVIARSISKVIHEDIDRIELCFYLEGYKYGFYNNKWINILEEMALKCFDLDILYDKNYLFHFNYCNNEVNETRRKIRKEITNKENETREFTELIELFASKVIKPKLENIDNYIDRQLKLEFNPYEFNIKEEKINFTKDELERVYKAIIKELRKNLLNIFKDSCWYALNDRVLKRYPY
ncbi:hypothetical protein GOQ29_01305 [Clostridium sp. D2Q-14]|uniref:hypothetical protein n=1 Tax=Anaeromonas gelatinilytica TaxID=2683194 RepID=UPI00193B995D|nr:hypothetical protein [Anaeromonas gelatinilytica]MBS4534249.1 hypothetical protein [Anaeromonas gelatinilytica]